jgi:N-acetylglucosamine kinase-like BadF-type ATPase
MTFQREMPRYFLGVDGGQSSTTAVIGDENGRILGVGRGGPCNHAGAALSQFAGRSKFKTAIRSSLQGACAQAGLSAKSVRFSSVCVGLSGGPADKQPMLREILAGDRILATDDALIALAGATAGKPGIVVIGGTGSIAFGRNPAGRTARAGGWGFLFGDEGGAFWIAREALRSALRWEEGWGEPTSLRARLLDATGARNMNHLLHRCYTAEFPRPRVAALAILVNHAAESGDLAALEILDNAARELALLANAVRGQLFVAGGPALVTYSGGVFHSRILLNRLRHWLASEDGIVVNPPVYGPATGALLEAYRGVLELKQPLCANQPFP